MITITDIKDQITEKIIRLKKCVKFHERNGGFRKEEIERLRDEINSFGLTKRKLEFVESGHDTIEDVKELLNRYVKEFGTARMMTRIHKFDEAANYFEQKEKEFNLLYLQVSNISLDK